MKILLNSIARREKPGEVKLNVQIGDETSKTYLGCYEKMEGNYSFFDVDEVLLMKLSDLAQKRYWNCTIYQLELMQIIAEFIKGKPLPEFPIELGTTFYGPKRPTKLQMYINYILAPFTRIWFRWRNRQAFAECEKNRKKFLAE